MNLMAERIDQINTPQKLGLAIKRMRKAKGLSQDELAERIKIRQPTLSEFEKGGGSVVTLFKIIQELNLNLSVSDQGKKVTEKKEDILKFFQSLEEIES